MTKFGLLFIPYCGKIGYEVEQIFNLEDEMVRACPKIAINSHQTRRENKCD